jgi:three-Cys-motif partner protein
MTIKRELYEGREQTYAKHCILEGYLQKLAFKVGWNGVTLNYIDGFAGPWKSKSDTLEDTSPHIALRVLRAAREALSARGRPPLSIRAMFVERGSEESKALEASLVSYSDVETEVRHVEFEDVVADAVRFGHEGSKPFCFTFIDPCGWTGYGLKVITPLLQVRRSEVLVNFMTNSINEWIDDPRPQTAATFEDLFGSTGFRDAWHGLRGIDRQEAIVQRYCQRLREAGGFRHVVSAVILMPGQDRAHYHLVYATRKDEGLRVFREIERATLATQGEMRGASMSRRRQQRSGGQQELPFMAQELGTRFLRDLIHRYRDRAVKLIASHLPAGASVPFDRIAVQAMQIPMVAEQDVRDLLMEMTEDGRIAVDGLQGRQRTPQWRRGHSIRLLGDQSP